MYIVKIYQHYVLIDVLYAYSYDQALRDRKTYLASMDYHPSLRAIVESV